VTGQLNVSVILTPLT